MKVVLTSRDSTVEISNKYIEIVNNAPQVKSDFFEKLNLEVMQHPKKANKLISLLSTTQTMFGLMFVQNGVSYASAKEPLPLPKDLSDTILIIIGVTAALGVAIAILSLMLAGVWKMLFGANRADQWSSMIIKGLVQVIAAPLIVALIVSIFTLLFSNVPAFQPIANPIATFFHR